MNSLWPFQAFKRLKTLLDLNVSKTLVNDFLHPIEMGKFGWSPYVIFSNFDTKFKSITSIESIFEGVFRAKIFRYVVRYEMTVFAKFLVGSCLHPLFLCAKLETNMCKKEPIRIKRKDFLWSPLSGISANDLISEDCRVKLKLKMDIRSKFLVSLDELKTALVTMEDAYSLLSTKNYHPKQDSKEINKTYLTSILLKSN